MRLLSKADVMSRTVMLALCLVLSSSSAFAQRSFSTSTQHGKELTIRSISEWDKRCEGNAALKVVLNRAPAGGHVCIRRGIYTPVQSSFDPPRIPQCLGKSMAGVHLIYVPGPGFVGADNIHLTVPFRTGAVVYEIEIAVEAASTQGSAMSARGTMRPNRDKNVGEEFVPECAPLLSAIGGVAALNKLIREAPMRLADDLKRRL